MHEPEKHPHRRRLARSVRSEEPEDAAARDAQRQLVDRDDLAVALREIRGLDDELALGGQATASAPTVSANWL